MHQAVSFISDESLLDHVSSILFNILQRPCFKLSLVSERSLNRLFIYEAENSKYLIKAFKEEVNDRNFGKDIEQRYQCECLVLKACAEANVPVPQLINAIDEHQVLIASFLEGNDLGSLKQDQLQQPALLKAVAMWLYQFHQVFQRKSYKSTFKEYLTHKVPPTLRDPYALPQYYKQYQHILDTYGDLEIKDLCIARNDCHLGNFMLVDDQLVGIDFELCAYQVGEYEVASFLSHYFKHVVVGERREAMIKIMSEVYAQENDLYITERKIRGFLEAKELFQSCQENIFSPKPIRQ